MKEKEEKVLGWFCIFYFWCGDGFDIFFMSVFKWRILRVSMWIIRKIVISGDKVT